VDGQTAKLRGEESLSIVRRGKWCWKTYKPLDPTGRWPSAVAWQEQLASRVVLSRAEFPPLLINRVRRWFPCELVAVSRFIPAARETTAEDVAYVKLIAPKWVGDIKSANIIIMDCGPVTVPVLIDFCTMRT
jgi:hypothetical protein